VVSLLQRSSAKPVPDLIPIHRTRHLQRYLQIPTLNREVEPRLLVLDEMESDLRVSLFLEICNDTLSDKVRVSDDLQHLIVVLAHERELKSVFSWVDSDGAGCASTVEAVHDLTFDAGQVDRLLQCLDDTVITNCQGLPQMSKPAVDSPLRKSVFDMIQGSIDENSAIVPSGGFDPDCLVYQCTLAE
jgi:hypothetical protein